MAPEAGLHTEETSPEMGAYDTCSVTIKGSSLTTERVRKVLHPDAPLQRIEADVLLLDAAGQSVGIARLCAQCNRSIRDRMGMFLCAAGQKD
jgi:hypothetical protein